MNLMPCNGFSADSNPAGDYDENSCGQIEMLRYLSCGSIALKTFPDQRTYFWIKCTKKVKE